MRHTLYPFLVLFPLLVTIGARFEGTSSKNPVEIRVTSAAGDAVHFRLEVRGGVLIRVGADGRWYGAPGGPGVTPAQYRAFPQGAGLVFTSDNGRPLHVEAWRTIGDTRHASADGSVLVVRVDSPRDPPEVVPMQATRERAEPE